MRDCVPIVAACQSRQPSSYFLSEAFEAFQTLLRADMAHNQTLMMTLAPEVQQRAMSLGAIACLQV